MLEARERLLDYLKSPATRSSLQAYVRRRGLSDSADDLVQTVLCDALAAPAVPDRSSELPRFVTGIARNKVVDEHRRRARWKRADVPEELAAPASTEGAPAAAPHRRRSGRAGGATRAVVARAGARGRFALLDGARPSLSAHHVTPTYLPTAQVAQSALPGAAAAGLRARRRLDNAAQRRAALACATGRRQLARARAVCWHVAGPSIPRRSNTETWSRASVSRAITCASSALRRRSDASSRSSSSATTRSR